MKYYCETDNTQKQTFYEKTIVSMWLKLNSDSLTKTIFNKK